MEKLSVLVPARNDVYLQQTINDLFSKAKEDIEIIVTLDGYWPDPIIEDNPNLTIIHNTNAAGLRAGINRMVNIANGKYIMKVDAHCMFGDGYDVALKHNFEDSWIAAPSRYSLNAEKWERGYGPIEYLFLTYPYKSDNQFGEGLHGKKWLGENGLSLSLRPSSYYYRERERADIKIDDIQSFQGSCWFMTKKKFLDVGGFDNTFGSFYQEAQEISFKVWMSGGRTVVNKHTWYAHYHKNTPSGYGFTRSNKHAVQRYFTWYWMNNKWPMATRTIEDFIEENWPMPGWPENWKEEKERFEREHKLNYEKPPRLQ